MPRTFHIDRKNGLVISVYAGALTHQDVLDQWTEIGAHPEFDPCLAYLTDLSAVTEYTISSSEIRELTRRADPFSFESVRVVIAPKDDLFGIVRMYQMSGDVHPNLTVVRSYDEASRVFHEYGMNVRLAEAAGSNTPQ